MGRNLFCGRCNAEGPDLLTVDGTHVGCGGTVYDTATFRDAGEPDHSHDGLLHNGKHHPSDIDGAVDHLRAGQKRRHE